jgi:hypothetical protein
MGFMWLRDKIGNCGLRAGAVGPLLRCWLIPCLGAPRKQVAEGVTSPDAFPKPFRWRTAPITVFVGLGALLSPLKLPDDMVINRITLWISITARLVWCGLCRMAALSAISTWGLER